MQRLRTLLGLALVFAAAGVARAQEVRGTLMEADGQTPARGVLVLATSRIDGRTVDSTRTSATGSYRLRVGPDSVVVFAVRPGVQPTLIGRVRLERDDVVVLTTAMQAVPIELSVRTTIAVTRCGTTDPERRRATASLFEQIIAALMASTELDTHLTARTLTRVLTSSADERMVFSDRWSVSTASVPEQPDRNATDLHERGFHSTLPDLTEIYHRPGADFFTSPAFLADYCLLPMSPSARHGFVGVYFRPVSPRRDVVQISGSFWLRSDDLVLDGLLFRYEGLPVEAAAARAEGWIEFSPVGDGLSVQTAWEIRMPQLARGSRAYRPRGEGRVERVERFLQVSGIRVASSTIQEIAREQGTLFSSGVRDTVARRVLVRRPAPRPPVNACAETLGDPLQGVLIGHPTGATISGTNVAADGSFVLCGVLPGRAVEVVIRDQADEVLHRLTVRVPEGTASPFLEVRLPSAPRD